MKAYKVNKYGPPEEVLNLVETIDPEPEKNEVQIRVRATSVNDYDWCLSSGKPLSYRFFFGIFRPRKKMRIPGMEVAGIVEKIGRDVSKFKVGDEVYGDISDYGYGSFAELLCIDEKALSLKPDFMSFEEATSLPHASLLAFQGLIKLGHIRDGLKVLINGGGGGMGTFGIQIAKIFDVSVTGVDTGEKLKQMEDLGYDTLIDYQKEDFTRGDERYDLILDCRTNRSLFKYVMVLKPGGKYVTIGGKTGKLLQMIYVNPILKWFSSKRVLMVMLKANRDLDRIEDWYREGKIRCVIDGPYSFEEIPRAVQRFGDAQHVGKIVISVRSKDLAYSGHES